MKVLGWFPGVFKKQANWYAAYYGAPVYLVGSALTKERPRDIDVRITLSDEEFWRFYGRPIPPHEGSKDQQEMQGWQWSQLADHLKRNRKLGHYGGYPIDFQLQTLAEAKQFEHKERIRLDDAPDWVLEAGL